MGIYEIKLPLATKQFTLDITPKTYCLTICAYGDMWEERRNDWAKIKTYVQEEWGFTEEQAKELYKEADVNGCKRITSKEADFIIDFRKPLGMFYLKSENDLYVGIDNRTGDAWTEDFKSLSTCKNWLRK